MRIAVTRLDFLLRLGQFRAKLHPIVVIFAALREERMEGAEELRQEILSIVQTRRETLIEIAGGGVEGAVESPLVSMQDIPVAFGDPGVHVDRFESPLRGQRQPKFGGSL